MIVTIWSISDIDMGDRVRGSEVDGKPRMQSG